MFEQVKELRRKRPFMTTPEAVAKVRHEASISDLERNLQGIEPGYQTTVFVDGLRVGITVREDDEDLGYDYVGKISSTPGKDSVPIRHRGTHFIPDSCGIVSYRQWLNRRGVSRGVIPEMVRERVLEDLEWHCGSACYVITATVYLESTEVNSECVECLVADDNFADVSDVTLQVVRSAVDGAIARLPEVIADFFATIRAAQEIVAKQSKTVTVERSHSAAWLPVAGSR